MKYAKRLHLNSDHPIEKFLSVLIWNISDSDENLTNKKAISSLKNNKEIIILLTKKVDVTVIINLIFKTT